MHDKEAYPVQTLCQIAGIQRSSYYKWRNKKSNTNELFNFELISLIKKGYQERNGILGYRQMTIKLTCKHNISVNHIKKFSSLEDMEAAVIEYIDYYNHRRYQKRLNCMAPIEFRHHLLHTAA